MKRPNAMPALPDDLAPCREAFGGLYFTGTMVVPYDRLSAATLPG